MAGTTHSAAVRLARSTPDQIAPARCTRVRSRGLVARARTGLSRRVGARAGHAHRLPRRLRPGRGSRARGLRRGGRTLAARRAARQPRGLADHHGAPPRHRPPAARPHAGREDQAPHRPRGDRRRGRRKRPRRREHPRRAPRAHLHLLPPGARPGRAGGAHLAHPRRPLHRRDRPRLSGARGHHGAAPGARQAQDQDRRHSLSRAAGSPAGRTPGGRAGCRLPDLQRGLRRARRAGGRGAAPRPLPRRSSARRARGARPARPDGAARRAPRRALRRRRARAAGRPGPRALGRAEIAEGRAALARALALGGRGPYVLQAAIAAEHAAEPRSWDRIAALYAELVLLTGSPVVELNRAVAVAEAAVRRRVSSWSIGSSSTTTSTCTPRAPTCCAGWGAPSKRARATLAPSSWRRQRRSVASWNGG